MAYAIDPCPDSTPDRQSTYPEPSGLMERIGFRAPRWERSRPHAAAPTILIRRPGNPFARALARRLARWGWTVEIICWPDREIGNALVAEIWDAGGKVRAAGPPHP